MKNKINWIISSLLFIIGIIVCFLKPKDFEFNFITENIIFGITLMLSSIILSPLYKKFLKKENNNINFERVNNILVLFVFDCYLLYFAEFHNYSFLPECIDNCGNFKNITDYVILISSISIIVIYNLSLIKLKSLKKIRITNIIMFLICIVSYIGLKLFYINIYNYQTKNIEVQALEPKEIVSKQISNKYYFDKFYVEDVYENYDKKTTDTGLTLINETENKYIQFIKSDDLISNIYNSINKKDLFTKKILLFRFMLNNNIDSQYAILNYYSKHQKFNIFNSINDIYYGSLLGIPFVSNLSAYQKIIYKDLNMFIELNNTTDKKIYSLVYYNENNVYVWRFIGNFEINQIYDFISTLNIEDNKFKKNQNNYINNNTTEDIKKIFNKRIEKVKTGKEDKTLLCNLKNENNQINVDCTKITDFNIKKIDKVDSLENGDVYEIQFEVKCSSDNICFYNEQLETENNLLKIKTYYLIKDNVIVESLGNSYFLGD